MQDSSIVKRGRYRYMMCRCFALPAPFRAGLLFFGPPPRSTDISFVKCGLVGFYSCSFGVCAHSERIDITPSVRDVNCLLQREQLIPEQAR